MEHRNSTVLSNSGALRNPRQRGGILSTVAHEFFHSWNMERIRAKDIEPFNFEEADVSGELWLGEGFTSYYDELITRRANLTPLDQTLAGLAGTINAVTLSPGRQFRTAEEMSRLAPLVDAAAAIDRTSWDNTFISYYTYGAAIGLALDLSLRDRSNGQTSLDTYMKALWARHGRPGQKDPGMVATPYTMDDLKNVLVEVSGDRAFAMAFFASYIQGHDVADYGALLARAGMVLRKRNPGTATLGPAQLSFSGGGARVGGAVTIDSPLYKTGIDRDDLIVSIARTPVTTQDALNQVLGQQQPGAKLPIRFVRRSGETVNGSIVLDEDPNVEIVPIERTGGSLTDAQKRFRDDWLGSKQ
jgi:predicted metalloprotease with PDZ domain